MVVGHRFNYAVGQGGQLIVLLPAQDMMIVVVSRDHLGEHGGRAWTHEQANFNLVGRYIRSLPAAE